MCTIRRTLATLLLCCSSPLWAADWIGTEKLGEVVHFTVPTPPQIQRFDLPSRTWLSAIPLPGTRGELTAATVDGNELYVAYDTTVYRYDLNGQNEQLVTTVESKIHSLFTDGNLLIINQILVQSGNGRVIFVDRAQNTIIPNNDPSTSAHHGATISRTTNRIFGVSSLSSGDVIYRRYLDSGVLDGGRSANLNGKFEPGKKTWLSPNESLLFTDRGACHATSDLTYIRSLGGLITDLQFDDSGLPVALIGSTLYGYNNAYLQARSATLSREAKSIFMHNGDVLAFSPGSGTTIALEAVALSNLLPIQPVASVDPKGLPFTPDAYLVDKDGIILLLSKAHRQIFRWAPSSQSFLPSIPLVGAPDFVTYSPQAHTVYLAYSGGLVRQLDLQTAEPKEVPLFQMHTPPKGLSMAGDYLFTVDRTGGGGHRHLTYTPEGVLISLIDSREYSEEYTWSQVSQKMYHLKDSGTPADLFWTEINATGTAYPGLAPGAIGAKKDSPYHGEPGYIHPIRLSADGSKLLLGSGTIHDAITLQRQIEKLTNAVTDATWTPSQIISVHPGLAGTDTEIQRWMEPDFTQASPIQIPGSPKRILPLPNGQYVICALPSDGVPSLHLYDDSLSLQAPPALQTPEKLRVAITSGTSLELSWCDVSGETAYHVEKCTLPSGIWLPLASTSMSITKLVDTDVQQGTSYAYRVTASHGSLMSVTSTPIEVIVAPPEKPILTAEAISSSQIKLTWPEALRAQYYRLYLRKVPNTAWILHSQGNIIGTTLTHNSLSSMDHIEYKLEAYNGLGSSPASEIVSAITHLAPPAIPRLNSMETTLPTEVLVRWGAVVLAESYLVERSLSTEDAWTAVATVTAPTTQHLDTTVEDGTTYKYRVIAINAAGSSSSSNIETVTIPPAVIPGTPLGFRYTLIGGPTARLAWNSLDNEVGLRVFRRVADGEWTLLTTLPANTVTYNDTPLQPGQNYSYQVVAFNATGEAPSAQLDLQVPLVGLLLRETFDPAITSSNWISIEGGQVRTAPTGFYDGNALWMGGSGNRIATLFPMDLTRGSVTLKLRFRAGNTPVDGAALWDSSEVGDNVVFEYSNDGYVWTTLTTFTTTMPGFLGWSSATLNISNSILTSTTRFRWRQVQHSGDAQDTWALDNVEVYGILPERPGAIFPFVVRPNTSNSVTLTWGSSARATGYEVQRRTPATDWATIASVAMSARSYTDATVQPATAYTYRVVGINLGGSSPPSEEKSLTTWTSFDDWQFLHYGTRSDNGTAGATADNGTGVPNLLKFAFNMGPDDGHLQVPSTGGTKGLPSISYHPETGVMRVAFVRRRAAHAPDIEYLVQFSDNLIDWAVAGQEISATPIDQNFEHVVWEDAAPPVGEPERKSRFGRVKVVE